MDKDVSQKIQIWQVVMLFLCVYVLTALFIQTIFSLPDDINNLLNLIDNWICVVFLADFIINLLTAKKKLHYLKWGWIDLISSIPNLEILRWGRFARVFRILRILRGFRSSKYIIQYLLQYKAKSTLALASLISFVLIVFGSMAILNSETDSGANIKTAGDALWWAFVTITTVGYGDFYPVTTLGRIVATALMISGIGLFAAFTAYVASIFLTYESKEEKKDDAVLKELGEIKKRLERIEANQKNTIDD